MGFKNDDYINVSNGCSSPMYFEGALKNEGDYKLEPIRDGEDKIFTPISYATLLRLNRTSVIKKQFIKIDSEIEEEVLKALRIDLSKEKESYSTEEIEDMILYSDDSVIREIVSIKSENVVKRFLEVLIGLKSTNQYDISVKLENYIRGRLQEIEEGNLETELDPTPTLNERKVETAVVGKEDIKDNEIVQDTKPATKKRSGKQTTK